MKIAVVVSSCDFFEDCWEPFIYCVQKYWKDCPYPLYIVSNHKSIETSKGISFIKVGEDKKFSSNLEVALNQIEADSVIYLQEDYWLNRPVDNNAIEEHIRYCVNNDMDYLRLSFPFLRGNRVNDQYREHSLIQKYTLCLQAAIWKKSTLMQLLIEGDSGWDFEYKIQQYAIDNHIKVKALSLVEKHVDKGFNYVLGTAVRKGRWTREGYRFLKENGFETWLPKRKQEGWVFGNFQEVHGPLRLFCMAIVKIMKIKNWNF